MAKKKVIAAVLALTVLASGCSNLKRAAETSGMGEAFETTVETSAVETTEETTTETTKAPEPYTFNRHVHTELLSVYVTENMWTSLYNYIDAIYAGEDTFKCTDEKAYEWCTDDTVAGVFLPPVCCKVSGAGFKDGVAKIKYKMDKDKLKERISVFETEIVRMLNEAVRSDYSDFEKVFSLYAYMCKNFQYDYSPIDGNGVDDFSDYACLMSKKGICCEIASSYSYLLLQIGIESMPMGGNGTGGNHSWTYVKLGDNGFHLDATWALYGGFPNGILELQYFMMTEKERAVDFAEKMEPDWLWPWTGKFDMKDYPATDEKFEELHEGGCIFQSIDMENNTIKYSDPNGEIKTLSYGDM